MCEESIEDERNNFIILMCDGEKVQGKAARQELVVASYDV